jgi:DNA-binding transcriptional ArsR family regulator
VRSTELDTQQIALISRAIADPKRFEILHQISQAHQAPTCSCVRECTGLSAPTISHHLKELEGAGLIHIERAGKFAYLTLRRNVWDAYLKQLAEL